MTGAARSRWRRHAGRSAAIAAIAALTGCKFPELPAVGEDGAANGDAMDSDGAATDAMSVADAGTDARVGTWSAPMPLALNVQGENESGPNASPTETELYFTAPQAAGSFVQDIFYVTRSGTAFDWGTSRTPVNAVNSTGNSDVSPRVSADGLELYFARVGLGVYVSKRASPTSAWGSPSFTNLQGDPDILADGVTMYLNDPSASCPVDTCRVKVTRPDRSSLTWGNPAVESINDGPRYQTVDISGDGLRALLSAPGTSGVAPVAIATRGTRTDPWGDAVPIPELAAYTGITGAAWNWQENEMYFTWVGGDIYMSKLR